MGSELYFTAPEKGLRRPVGDYVQRLTEAGYLCHEEADEWGHWVVFDGFDSTLNFSIENSAATFATLEMSTEDPAELLEAIEGLFADAGWDLGGDGES